MVNIVMVAKGAAAFSGMPAITSALATAKADRPSMAIREPRR